MPHPVFTPTEVALLTSTNYILSPKDHAQLSTPDDQFTRLSWEMVKEIIRENRLQELKRLPSDLRRYILWCETVRRDYDGGVMGYILRERLRWDNLGEEEVEKMRRSVVPSGKGGLFEVEDDVKILTNDWPYGLTPDIIHLVVWTKIPIPIAEDGDLTPDSRRRIDEFVDKVFSGAVGKENVVWFKNWRSLQSVPSVEHMHVLVRGATEEMLKEWVEGPWGTKGMETEKLRN